MDNRPAGPDPGADDRAPVLTFSPNRLISAGFLLVWLVFAVLLVFTADRPGRLLYGLACVVLAAICATDLVWRPRLRVDRHGVQVRSPSTSARLAWPQIERLAVEERQRFGVTVRALEIDAGEQLIILSGRSLGTDPRRVAQLARALRPPADPPVERTPPFS